MARLAPKSSAAPKLLVAALALSQVACWIPPLEGEGRTNGDGNELSNNGSVSSGTSSTSQGNGSSGTFSTSQGNGGTISTGTTGTNTLGTIGTTTGQHGTLGTVSTTGTTGQGNVATGTNGTTGQGNVATGTTGTTGTTGQGNGTTGTTGLVCGGVGAVGAASTSGGSGSCQVERFDGCIHSQANCANGICHCTDSSGTTWEAAEGVNCNAAFDECFNTNGGTTSAGNGTTSIGSTGTTGQGNNSTGSTGTTGQGSSTPIVLAFDDAPLALSEAAGRFDLAGVGRHIPTRWPAARTPWLALDVDGNGRIDDGRELFGSMSELPSGRTAKHGFEALAALDANHDGVLDARDPAFARLVLWSDADQDRASSAGELVTLASVGITSLEVAFTARPACSAEGDCAVERGTFRYVVGGQEKQGALIDLHLRHLALPSLAQR